MNTETYPNTSDTLSGRLNMLFDLAGFSHGRGRTVEVQRFYGCKTRSVSQGWVKENVKPRSLASKIKLLQTEGRLPTEIDSKKAEAWVEKGNSVVQNPLLDFDKSEELDHKIISKLYLAVYNYAIKAGVDVHSLPDDIARELYTTLLADARERHLDNPDEVMIKALLSSAMSKSLSSM